MGVLSVCEIVRNMAAALRRKSGYLLNLSAEAKQRYETMVLHFALF